MDFQKHLEKLAFFKFFSKSKPFYTKSTNRTASKPKTFSDYFYERK